MKLKYFVLAIASVLILAGCSTKSLKIEISKSEKFTEKEIRSAINEVKKAADDYIEGSRLSKLTYDELESNQLCANIRFGSRLSSGHSVNVELGNKNRHWFWFFKAAYYLSGLLLVAC